MRYAQHIKRRLPPRVQRFLSKARRQLIGSWGPIRVHRRTTRWLGPEFRRSRRRLEIDLTWACNLRCFNCNRSCEQAPTGEQMSAAQIQHFVAECVVAKKHWDQIRILGGEPTLHPEFDQVLTLLSTYVRDHSPTTRLVLVTNGHGDKVQQALRRVPPSVTVENTAKTSAVQPAFSSFNIAPTDLQKYQKSDFRNGCWVTENCGTGLTPYGYYPCAVAGGIDRIFGANAARPSLPDDADDMHDQLEHFCRLCGHFKRDDDSVDATQSAKSSTWQDAYQAARANPPVLSRYGPG